MLLPLKSHTLYYDIVGPANGGVVCFGHSLAADGGMWAEQVPELVGAGYRVLRVDMRGHGGSTPAPGDYTIDQLADDVIATADALEIRQFHFVGLSIGGMFGQSLGIRYGNRIQSLMLCDSQPASPVDAQARWNPRIEAARKAGSMEPLADATMDRWLTEDFHRKNPLRWNEIHRTVAATTVQGYVGCTRAIQNFDFRPLLPTIKARTLIVVGSDDPGAPPEESQAIVQRLSNGRFEEIAGAKHLPNVEFPEQFNRLLVSWLKA